MHERAVRLAYSNCSMVIGMFEATPLVGESTEEARHAARHG
jgi:hypothetical protein